MRNKKLKKWPKKSVVAGEGWDGGGGGWGVRQRLVVGGFGAEVVVMVWWLRFGVGGLKRS